MRLPEEIRQEMEQVYARRRVAVTGGAGFIGSALVGVLLDLGASVAVIDDLSSSDAEAIGALLERSPEGRLRFVHASILEPEGLEDATAPAETIFHLAAVTSVGQSFDEPDRCASVNALGTARVLEAARGQGASLIYAGSCSAYGGVPTPHREDGPVDPISPYAAAKLAGELETVSWARAYQMSAVSLRLFNVYGPGQRAGGAYAAAIPAFVDRLRRGEPPVIYGDGEQERDFVHIVDVVRAFLIAGAASDRLAGRIINIGSGKPISIAELARRIARLSGRPDIEPIHEAARPGDVRRSCADVSKAASSLGFEPQVDLDSGLADLIATVNDTTATVA